MDAVAAADVQTASKHRRPSRRRPVIKSMI